MARKNVAKRKDFPTVPYFPTVIECAKQLEQHKQLEYTKCQMNRLIDFQLPVSSDVIKAVICNRSMWNEYVARIKKQLENLNREKAQVSNEIEQLENSKVFKQLEDLSLYKTRLSCNIEMLHQKNRDLHDLIPE